MHRYVSNEASVHVVMPIMVYMCVFILQHLERLELECAQFHSTRTIMGDDMNSVSNLRDEYLKFLNSITVST